MDLKIDFVSISVPRKETNIFAMSPRAISGIFGITSSNQPGADPHLCLCQSPSLPQMMFVLCLNRRHPLYYKIGFT